VVVGSAQKKGLQRTCWRGVKDMSIAATRRAHTFLSLALASTAAARTRAAMASASARLLYLRVDGGPCEEFRRRLGVRRALEGAGGRWRRAFRAKEGLEEVARVREVPADRWQRPPPASAVGAPQLTSWRVFFRADRHKHGWIRAEKGEAE